MDHSELMNLIAQYQNEGGSLSSVVNDVNALMSSGKTPLGLNQWQRSDKPVMEDFNEDNRIIDEKLRELMANKAVEAPLVQYAPGFIEGIEAFNDIAACYCTRNPFNQVNLVIRARATIELTYGMAIAKLPQGFQPDKVVSIPAFVAGNLCSLDVIPDRYIRLYSRYLPVVNANIFCTGIYSAADQ